MEDFKNPREKELFFITKLLNDVDDKFHHYRLCGDTFRDINLENIEKIMQINKIICKAIELLCN